jgi:hypothetical protein
LAGRDSAPQSFYPANTLPRKAFSLAKTLCPTKLLFGRNASPKKLLSSKHSTPQSFYPANALPNKAIIQQVLQPTKLLSGKSALPKEFVSWQRLSHTKLLSSKCWAEQSFYLASTLPP